MVITPSPELEAALNHQARQQGVTPEALALDALKQQFLNKEMPIQPQDEWERRLISVARDCGVSLSDAALGREELYE